MYLNNQYCDSWWPGTVGCHTICSHTGDLVPKNWHLKRFMTKTPVSCHHVDCNPYFLHNMSTCGSLCTPHARLIRGSLTHWGRVTHICVGNLTIIGADNGLSPGRRQTIIWTNAGILLIGPLGTNFNEILNGIQTFSYTKMHLKVSAKRWPSCLGLNVLTWTYWGRHKKADSLQQYIQINFLVIKMYFDPYVVPCGTLSLNRLTHGGLRYHIMVTLNAMVITYSIIVCGLHNFHNIQQGMNNNPEKQAWVIVL